MPLKLDVGWNTKLEASAGVRGAPATTGVPSALVSTPWLARGKVATDTETTVPSGSVPDKLTAMSPPSSAPVTGVTTPTGDAFGVIGVPKLLSPNLSSSRAGAGSSVTLPSVSYS